MTHVTVVYRENSLTDEDLADILSPIVAFCHGKPETFHAVLDRQYVGGRGYVTTASRGNASTVLRRTISGDVPYVAEDPDAVYDMQEAELCQEAAERLHERRVPDYPLPY